jgi:hypothetical protein
MSRDVEMMYDHIQDRWIVELNDCPYGLHCGECFELIIGLNNLSCRLERDSQWYIMMEDVRLNLRAHDTYKVNI